MSTSSHVADSQRTLQFSDPRHLDLTPENTQSVQGLGTPVCLVWGLTNVAEGWAQVKVIGIGDRGQEFANHLVLCSPRFFDSSKDLKSIADIQAAAGGTHLLFLAVDPEIPHDINLANEIAQSAKSSGNSYVTLICLGTPTSQWDKTFASRILLTDTAALESLSRVACGLAWATNHSGLIAVDIEDVKSGLTACGSDSRVGLGCANGSERAQEAALQALSTLQDQGVILSDSQGAILMLAGAQLKLFECKVAMNLVRQNAGQDTEFIYVTCLDDSYGDNLLVTVIAGGKPIKEQP